MKRIQKRLESLDYEEARDLLPALHHGELRSMVEARIAAFEQPSHYCAVCHAAVEPRTAITLIFGPQGLRQRALFDAEDCLQHFVAKRNRNV